MRDAGIVVPVYIDAVLFRDFALFDSFYRQKRWRPLALFAGILLSSALLCFVFRERAEQAVFLGVVLTVIALGLPAVYFLNFLSSIKRQSRKMRLSVKRRAYVLTFGAEEGIVADTGKERLTFGWADVYAVYRARRAVYLYVAQQKAYLLPDAQVEGGAEALWGLLTRMIPEGRVFDCR